MRAERGDDGSGDHGWDARREAAAAGAAPEATLSRSRLMVKPNPLLTVYGRTTPKWDGVQEDGPRAWGSASPSAGWVMCMREQAGAGRAWAGAGL